MKNETIEFDGKFYQRTGQLKTPEGDELFIGRRSGDDGCWEDILPIQIMHAPEVWVSSNPLREIVCEVPAPAQSAGCKCITITNSRLKQLSEILENAAGCDECG